jgi:hypothetical protein
MFRVLELAKGKGKDKDKDFSEHLEQGPTPVTEPAALAPRIAAPLEAAHARGIAYCNLDPANSNSSSARMKNGWEGA